MATTEKIIEAAENLGKMMSEHEAAQTLMSAQKALDADSATQKVIQEFDTFAQQLNAKQQNQQPIEVAEKQQLEEYQSALAANPIVGRFQMAQMDYMDLMRKTMEAMESQAIHA